MLFSYNFLQSFFKEKLPTPEKLANILVMHFFEVENIEKKGKDFCIDIDVLPSRAQDCFSHIGVAREISAITGLKCNFPETKNKDGKEDVSEFVAVEVNGGCRRYVLRVIKDVNIGPSPKFIQDRLTSCGIKPINNVVDITNYVMLETGQPLHAFDGEKIEGNKIIVRYAKNREKMVTLEGKRRELDESILVISDEVSSVGIAGIKGGAVPEIDENTKLIFLEGANFDPLTIRRGSRKLGLRTDASIRFEHGISVKTTKLAVERAASMIESITKGKITGEAIDVELDKEDNPVIDFILDDITNLLGVDISATQVEKILKSLSFNVERKGENFKVIPAYFRRDINIKEDIIEEIGRVYGYENISSKMPSEEIYPSKESKSLWLSKVCRKEMRALGFVESYNYSFIDENTAQIFNYKNLQEMEKPVSLEYKYLRPSLIPGLVKNIAINEKIIEDVSLFEIGKIFSGIEEKKSIAGVCSSCNFLKLKGKVNLFLQRLFVEKISYHQIKENAFLDVVAEIRSKGESIGLMGEVSAKIKRDMGIKNNVVVFEIDMGKLESLSKERELYHPISKFPTAQRDLSLLVPEKTEYKEIKNNINKVSGKLLKDIELFDVYNGKELPKNKKSIAFRLFFRADNRTLSSQEISDLQNKIIEALEKIPEWKVRK